MTERFNPNNSEINKKRFQEQFRKLRKVNLAQRGAKFTSKEAHLELSASDNDISDIAKKRESFKYDSDKDQTLSP